MKDMRNILTGLLALVLCSSALHAQGPEDQHCSHTPEQYQSIVADMQKQMAAAGVPGGSIAIVCNGHLNFAAGVGVKRYDASDPVTPDTLFRAASLTKMVTAASVMPLVDEGRLDLARAITDYLPWFAVQPPYDASSITAHLLLTHQAGMPNYPGVCQPGIPLEQFFRENNPWPLTSAPGRYWNYSNTNFALAGLLAETVDGRPYDELVRARVLAPAGMTTATFDPAVAEAGNHTTGHTLDRKGTVTATWEPTAYDCTYMHPAGSLFASVRDYGHLAEVLLNRGRGVLRRWSNQALQTPYVWTRWTPDRYYAYGFWPDQYKGIDIVAHTGSTNGWQSYFLMVPGTKDAVVVLLNGLAGGFFRLGVPIVEGALDILYDLQEVPPADYSTPPSTWTVYEGTYHHPSLGDIQVGLRGETLWGNFLELNWSGPFTQEAGDTFQITPRDNPTLRAIFQRDGEEPARAMVFFSSLVAERID